MRFENSPYALTDVLDARPLGDGWAVLQGDGTLGGVRLDLVGLIEPLEIHVSDDGQFAAVVERYGRRGRVFQGGTPTMALDRGDYHPGTSVFPAAFFQHRGRTLLVHGTDWNRLDVSDPTIGECMTSRGPTRYQEGETEPTHYLDYFHGGLHLSPDGARLADDGWIWHPIGEVRVWSTDRWLENPWESEDGPSLRQVAFREDWDMPLCWINDHELAVWGTGGVNEGDESTGIWTFDVEAGTRTLRVDPGTAADRPWPPGTSRSAWMTFDRFLFAVSPSTGTTVWSLEGERLHFEPGFAPRRYHPDRKEFLSWGEGEAFASRLVP